MENLIRSRGLPSSSGNMSDPVGDKKDMVSERGADLSSDKPHSNSVGFYLFLAGGSLVIIGSLDWYLAHRISLMPFYLIPIIMASVLVGRLAGVAMSVMCALVWLSADLGVGVIDYHYALTPYWNALVRLVFFLLVVGAIALKDALQIEKTKARIDPLTGIPNRMSFYELARQEIARSKRYSRPLSMVFFDLNGFKKINDRFGHHIGDKVLRRVGESIRENTRGEDVAARWGGDEFVVLLPETDYKGSIRFVNRLNRAFVKISDQELKGMTASFGIKPYMIAPGSVDEMVKAADDLMYAAKRVGTLYKTGASYEKDWWSVAQVDAKGQENEARS
ncbi:MAG: sensor domain-containing diguanylate cyclase [Candidatus Omnitrophica bacterium]|nr:sensor domain-containing diguanylate cyclase [Candidatus Omnitrophota bacterium]